VSLYWVNHVNPFQCELCNHAKETLIPSMVNYAIVLERLFILSLEGYEVVALERCRVNPILGEICNRTRETMLISFKVNYAIVLGRLISLICAASNQLITHDIIIFM
jgi:hypothetical protein